MNTYKYEEGTWIFGPYKFSGPEIGILFHYEILPDGKLLSFLIKHGEPRVVADMESLYYRSDKNVICLIGCIPVNEINKMIEIVDYVGRWYSQFAGDNIH